MTKKNKLLSSPADQTPGPGTTKPLALLLVVALWILPCWAVWYVITHQELQRGLIEWQIGILLWYPLIAVLMLFFAVVLYRRLPTSRVGLIFYALSTVGMVAVHWWLSGVASITLLVIEWAAFSLTLFVVGFSIELFRRIIQMAIKGSLTIAVIGGLANIGIFVMPGFLIVISLYTVLYQSGVFTSNWLEQIPYLFGLSAAILHDWRTFRML